MKPQTKLALDVVEEFASGNPDAEIDWREVEEAVYARVVLDVDALKRAAAADGTEGARRAVTRRMTDQMPLPGMPPGGDAFLPYDEHRSVRAPRAKLDHIVGATQLKQGHLNAQYAAFSAWQSAILPLYPYFARGMDWEAASRAYRRDHPEAIAAD